MQKFAEKCEKVERNFNEILRYSENSPHQEGLINKWTKDVNIYLYGEYTHMHKTQAIQVIKELNRLIYPRKINLVKNPKWANSFVYFGSKQGYNKNSMSGVKLTGAELLLAYISGYWDTGYYDYLAQLDYGKYLAGDIGSTLTLTRNFKNGWKAGGFFTLTNASFASFGEGSFDKGIFFTIPLNPFIPYETRGSFGETIRPIQGDGGARLEVEGRLYNKVNDYIS